MVKDQRLGSSHWQDRQALLRFIVLSYQDRTTNASFQLKANLFVYLRICGHQPLAILFDAEEDPITIALAKIMAGTARL